MEMAIVLSPFSAHRTAVAAATVVFPTPPFPENMIMRGLLFSILPPVQRLVFLPALVYVDRPEK